MDRARRAGVAALSLLVACAAAAVAAPAVRQPFAAADGPGEVGPLAGAVAWPPSADLVVAEIVTGGASASDEYVELTNAGPAAVDLIGLEVAYVTSSGSTVTRKASWATSLLLEPGRHLLIANSLGTYAAIADATYSVGFSATGGALVLRPIGGAPIDAVAWGDATNAFVEGTAASAPSPASAIERRPGGDGGNTIDTNDNASDFVAQPSPAPQNLLAPPVPAPAPSASSSPDPSPTPSPSPEASPSASPSPEPSPDASPSPSPSPSPSTRPSPDPSPSPSPDPVLSISEARALPDDSAATVEGIVTAALGGLESGRAGFMQDAGGGIGVYLDTVPAAPVAAGTRVRVRGLVDTRFGQRTIRAAVGEVTVIGSAAVPEPLVLSTGAAGEEFEGSRVSVSGTVTEAPSALADGLGVTVDDGSGPVRLIVGVEALAAASPATGDVVAAIGPLGQRDSTGTGVGGYRVHATLPGEFVVASPSPSPLPSVEPSPDPSPTPSASPSPDPEPSAAPSPSAPPSPLPSPTPDPSPSVSPGVVSVAAGRAMPVGSQVTVAATVTAEAGRLGTPSLLAVGDAGAGIAVKVAPGAVAPGRGLAVVVSGVIAQPYGQLEIRAGDDGVSVTGAGALPIPVPVDGATLGESVEGRLVVVTGTLLARPSRATSGDLTLRIEDAAGAEVRVLADASSGLDADRFAAGTTYRLVGIAGQRASRKGRLDGYRIWLRDAGDVTTVGTSASPVASSPARTPSPAGGGRGTQPTPIARATVAQGRELTIEGTVTAPASLLDATGRRIVVEDRTGAIEVLLPAGQKAPAVGDRVRASGEIGRAYGAPRLKADEVAVVGHGPMPAPRALRGSPGPAHEWRLVRISGTVVDLVRLGERWRAEVEVGRERVVISGLTGAGIVSTTLVEGRAATVVGIVRRPYPSATDRRFAVVPRSPRDVAVGPAATGPGAPGRGTPGPGGGSPRPGGRGSTSSGPTGPEDVDLQDLARHLGRTVRVGGLVVELAPDGFLLDDGTADASIVLRAAAAEYLPLLEPGDAVNLVGRVESADEGYRVVVEDPAGLTRVGDPGPTGEAAITAPLGTPLPASSPDGRAARRMGDLGFPPGIDATGTAGMVSLGLISLASVAMTLLRRERARRRLARRIAVRLAAVASPAVGRREGPSNGPPSVA